MKTGDQNSWLARRLISGMGIALIVYAIAIVWAGEVTIFGKRGPPTLYTGDDALSWAGMFACFGIGLLGVLFRRPATVGCWMGFWIFGGVAVNLIPVYF